MQILKQSLSKNGLFYISLAALVIPIILIEFPILHITKGIFVYPIDNVYLHSAIAENIAQNGTWGIFPAQFAPVTSSLLYPLLLAGVIKIVGSHLYIPLILNLCVAIALLYVWNSWLSKQSISPRSKLIILLGTIALIPLPILVIGSMEHLLQLLFTFLFITSFSSSLEKGKNLPPAVYIYGCLMVATRYEGLILLFSAALLLLIHRRFLSAIMLVTIAALPILIFGVLSISLHHPFIPDQLSLYSRVPSPTLRSLYNFITEDLFSDLSNSQGGYNIIAVQRLLILVALYFILFTKFLTANPSYRYMLILLLITLFVHLCTTGYSFFARYESALIGCSMMILGAVTDRQGQFLFKDKPHITSWMILVIIFLLTFPLAKRSQGSFKWLGQESLSTYYLQYNAGQFLHKYYDQVGAITNDLGAIAYFNAGKKMDMLGLANVEIAQARKHSYNTTEFYEWITKKEDIKIGIFSNYNFDPNLVRGWKKIAMWQEPTAAGGGSLSFYAVDPAIAAGLKNNLIDYQKILPPEEIATYY